MKFFKLNLESILLILIVVGIFTATQLALQNQNLQKQAATGGPIFCKYCSGTTCVRCGAKSTSVGECSGDTECGAPSGPSGTRNNPLACDCYNSTRTACRRCPDGGGGINNPPAPPPPLPPLPPLPISQPNGPCSDTDSDEGCFGQSTGMTCLTDSSVNCTNFGGIIGTDGQLACICGNTAPTAAPEIVEPTAAPTPTDIPAGTLTIAITVESPPENDFANLFSKLRLYVKEAGSVAQTPDQIPIEIPNASFSPNTAYITTVENKDPLLNYEVYVEFADATGTKFQFEGQTIEAKYTIYGIDYYCDVICNFDYGLYPNMYIDFKITLPLITQNLVGQASNNSILAVVGNWISGAIDRLNFLNFLKQIKDPPGLKKSTCDPSVPPYCKPIFN